MPRRPRPASRLPPKTNQESSRPKPSSSRDILRPKLNHIKFNDHDSEPSEEEDPNLQESFTDNGSESDEESMASEGSYGHHGEREEEKDVDVDAPRVAQWVDEDDDAEDDEGGSEDWEDTEQNLSGHGRSEVQLETLQDDLSNLPLGALRKAQRALTAVKVVDDSADNDASESDRSEMDEKSPSPAPKGKEKEKPEWSTKPRTDIAKRSNKHAPVEVTSKRPVTRRRTVVEVKTAQPRDPRFLPLAGEFSAQKFQQQYNFLADVHTSELKTLRENLKRAWKLLASSPQDLRAEREREVDRLELAVKRTESMVNKDRREKVESEALNRVAKEEREKRKGGKGGWWMKGSDKRDLLLRARYDALAATGGKRAVKKAVERKQRKIGQKEKKSRPFARGQGDGAGTRERRDAKRPLVTDHERGGKRRKLS